MKTREKKTVKVRKWRGLTTLFGSLCAVLVSVSLLAGSYIREINGFFGLESTKVVYKDGETAADCQYHESEYDSIDEMMQAKSDLSEEITDEGIVLMKNNDVLPLNNKGEITCLGRASTDLVYGGASGAGIIGNEGTSINKTLKEGLEEAGFKVNPTMWDFYSKSEYTRGSGGVGGMETYRLGEVPLSEYPDEKGYSDYNDACLVVFARNSGESNDAPTGEFEDGTAYYQLTETEKEILKEAEENFEKVIVLINSGSALSIEE